MTDEPKKRDRRVTMELSEETARDLARDLFAVPYPAASTVGVHADLIRMFPDIHGPHGTP